MKAQLYATDKISEKLPDNYADIPSEIETSLEALYTTAGVRGSENIKTMEDVGIFIDSYLRKDDGNQFISAVNSKNREQGNKALSSGVIGEIRTISEQLTTLYDDMLGLNPDPENKYFAEVVSGVDLKIFQDIKADDRLYIILSGDPSKPHKLSFPGSDRRDMRHNIELHGINITERTKYVGIYFEKDTPDASSEETHTGENVNVSSSIYEESGIDWIR